MCAAGLPVQLLLPACLPGKLPPPPPPAVHRVPCGGTRVDPVGGAVFTWGSLTCSLVGVPGLWPARCLGSSLCLPPVKLRGSWVGTGGGAVGYTMVCARGRVPEQREFPARATGRGRVAQWVTPSAEAPAPFPTRLPANAPEDTAEGGPRAWALHPRGRPGWSSRLLRPFQE